MNISGSECCISASHGYLCACHPCPSQNENEILAAESVLKNR